jgi:hypothetical protein
VSRFTRSVTTITLSSNACVPSSNPRYRVTRITAYKINKYFRDHKTLLEIFALVNHNLGTSSAGKEKTVFLLPNLTFLQSCNLARYASVVGKRCLIII